MWADSSNEVFKLCSWYYTLFFRALYSFILSGKRPWVWDDAGSLLIWLLFHFPPSYRDFQLLVQTYKSARQGLGITLVGSKGLSPVAFLNPIRSWESPYSIQYTSISSVRIRDFYFLVNSMSGVETWKSSWTPPRFLREDVLSPNLSENWSVSVNLDRYWYFLFRDLETGESLDLPVRLAPLFIFPNHTNQCNLTAVTCQSGNQVRWVRDIVPILECR